MRELPRYHPDNVEQLIDERAIELDKAARSMLKNALYSRYEESKAIHSRPNSDGSSNPSYLSIPGTREGEIVGYRIYDTSCDWISELNNVPGRAAGKSSVFEGIGIKPDVDVPAGNYYDEKGGFVYGGFDVPTAERMWDELQPIAEYDCIDAIELVFSSNTWEADLSTRRGRFLNRKMTGVRNVINRIVKNHGVDFHLGSEEVPDEVSPEFIAKFKEEALDALRKVKSILDAKLKGIAYEKAKTEVTDKLTNELTEIAEGGESIPLQKPAFGDRVRNLLGF